MVIFIPSDEYSISPVGLPDFLKRFGSEEKSSAKDEPRAAFGEHSLLLRGLQESAVA